VVKLKMTSTGKHSRLIWRPDGTHVGQALELANGRWAPFDMKDQRLVESGICFVSPKDVMNFFKAAEAGK